VNVCELDAADAAEQDVDNTSSLEVRLSICSAYQCWHAGTGIWKVRGSGLVCSMGVMSWRGFG